VRRSWAYLARLRPNRNVPMLEFVRGIAYLLGGVVALFTFAAGVVLLLRRVGLLGYVTRPAPMTPPDA